MRNSVERRSFRRVSGESSKTLRKLCYFTKLPHQEITQNLNILRSASWKLCVDKRNQLQIFSFSFCFNTSRRSFGISSALILPAFYFLMQFLIDNQIILINQWSTCVVQKCDFLVILPISFYFWTSKILERIGLSRSGKKCIAWVLPWYSNYLDLAH